MDTLSGKKRLSRLAFAVPLLLACLALPAEAAQGSRFSDPPARNSLISGNISIEQATAIARRETGGRVLSAIPKQRSTGTEYRIRMLVDGERVITVTVDPQGRVKSRR